MPEAQPGQEQRMEPWPLSETPCDGCGKPLNTKQGGSFVASSDGKAWHYGCAPILNRPTADLGEDGKLDRKLRARWFDPAAGGKVLINPDGPEAADRLEQLREALAEARAELERIGALSDTEHPQRAARKAAAKVSDVLSRSGEPSRP